MVIVLPFKPPQVFRRLLTRLHYYCFIDIFVYLAENSAAYVVPHPLPTRIDSYFDIVHFFKVSHDFGRQVCFIDVSLNLELHVVNAAYKER